jgi:hypothetical protein
LRARCGRRLAGWSRPVSARPARLNDDLWEKAPAVTDFVARAAKAPSRAIDGFRVAFDASTLCEVRANDPRAASRKSLSHAATTTPGDWIHVFIDSYQ